MTRHKGWQGIAKTRQLRKIPQMALSAALAPALAVTGHSVEAKVMPEAALPAFRAT
jgi:hypothetical protein